MKRAVLLALFAITACTTPVKLRNPMTGQTVQCGPYTNTGIPAAVREGRCISDYQRQGFERVPG